MKHRLHKSLIMCCISTLCFIVLSSQMLLSHHRSHTRHITISFPRDSSNIDIVSPEDIQHAAANRLSELSTLLNQRLSDIAAIQKNLGIPPDPSLYKNAKVGSVHNSNFQRRLMDTELYTRGFAGRIESKTKATRPNGSFTHRIQAGHLDVFPNKYPASASMAIQPPSITTTRPNGCELLSQVSELTPIGNGYTKAVHKADVQGKTVAIKYAMSHGLHLERCVKLGVPRDECVNLSNYKIMKEITLHQQLKHHNIVEMFGYCLHKDEREIGQNPQATSDNGIAATIITELGRQLDIIAILQLSWEDRLRISLGIASLLVYMSESPLGSLGIHDFKLGQFVLVGNQVKLSDIDDVDNNEPTCDKLKPCNIYVEGAKHPITTKCHTGSGKCIGMNEKFNLYNSYRYFFSVALRVEAPEELKLTIKEFLNKTATLAWGVKETFKALQRITKLYVSGAYLNANRKSTTTDYKIIPKADFTGRFDYWCPSSIHAGGNSCTLTVFNVQEAKRYCDNDVYCKAFVLTQQTSWTGRHVVFFKNNTSESVYNPSSTLYIRIV